MKRKTLIIPMSLCITAALSLGTPIQALAGSPEFSRTAEEWARLRDNVLEYGEIADLVHEYNSTVIQNENEYRKENSRTPKEITSAYLDAANSAWGAYANAQDGMTAAQSLMAARQAENAAEDNVMTEDKQRTQLLNSLAERNIVKQAQSTMNTYYQLQYQLTSLKKNRELLEATVTSTQGRQAQGMATQADVLNAQQNLQSADAQIIAMENQIESTRQNLIITLGWAQNATPEIRSMPPIDIQRILDMDVASDTQKALDADYTLQVHQRELEHANSDANRQIKRQTIEDEKQKIAVAVSDGYQKVIEAQSSYEEAVTNLEVAVKNWNAANTKYQLGSISRMEYLQEETSKVNAEMDVEVKNLQLFDAMENYDWVVKGVRS